jgi:hypothetical protein
MTDIDQDIRQYVEAAFRSVPVVPVDTQERPVATVPRRLRARTALVIGAFAAVLAIVVAVVAVSTSGDGGHLRKVVPPSEQPLFPDVVNHTGPELLLSPQTVPAGYQRLLATGPDLHGTVRSGSFGGQMTTQYWVRLDATGTNPQSAFTVAWGPAHIDEAQQQLQQQMGFPPTSGDALAPYRNDGTPITVAGHQAYWSPLGMIAWEQNNQIVVVASGTNSWVGTWPTVLAQADVEAIAGQVERNSDGAYTLNKPPAGFQLAGQAANTDNPGTNERRLVYSDGNNHGFAIQLTDNTQTPPSVALSWPGAQLVRVRNQTAVLTQFLNGGDGSGCATIDAFICTTQQVGVLNSTYLQWLEPDTTRVTITGVGLTEQQLLDIGRSLITITPEDWKQLTNASASIPCALTARCPATSTTFR